jgi:hemerythrin
MSFEWTESLSTGVKDIDDQHRELLARLTKVLELCSSSNSAGEVGSYLAYLREYIAFHFAAEEREMTTYKYPGLAAHEAEHEQFKQRINYLYRSYTEHGASTAVVVTTIRTSTEWLIQHIYRADKTMAAFLKEQKRDQTLPGV